MAPNIKAYSFGLIATAVTLAACGSSSSGDKSAPDSAIDGSAAIDAAAADAAGPGAPVTVLYRRAGTPLAGVTVYFQNADQTLAGSAQTDANGSASHTIGSGGFVTTVLASAGSGGEVLYAVETLSNVKPGDALDFGATASTTATMTVTSASTAGSTYTVDTTCGSAALTQGLSTTASGTVTLTDCGATTDMLVIASSETNGATKTAWNPNIPVVAAGTANLSAAYVAETPLAMSFTDIPTGFTTLAASSALSTANGRLATGAGSATPSGGSASVVLQRPVAAGAAMFNITNVSTGASSHVIDEIDQLEASGSAYALDVGANLMPQIATSPTYVAGSHSVTWTESNVGTLTPELAATTVTATRATTTWTWTVAQARNGQGIVLPTLPTDIFDFTISASDTVTVGTLTEAATPVSWDAIRPNVFGNLDLTAGLTTGASVQAERYSSSD